MSNLEQVNRLFNENFNNSLFIQQAKSWCFDFIKLLESKNISKNLIKEVIIQLFEKDNISNMNSCVWDFGDAKLEKECFFYLERVVMNNDVSYLEEGIRYALKNKCVYGNIIDAFINYVVVTNWDDFTIINNVKSLEIGKEAIVKALLGTFTLGYVKVKRDSRGICGVDFKVRENLRGKNIGARIHQALTNSILEEFPKANLYSNKVLSENDGGIRFYERFGGQITPTEDPDWVSVKFDEEAMLNIKNIEFPKPTLYQEKRLCVEIANEDIKSYLKKLIDNQVEYLGNGNNQLPSSLLLPQEIVLSQTVVENMIKDEKIECYGALDEEDGLQFSWVNDRVKTIVKILRKPLGGGTFTIDCLKELKDGKVVSIYDTTNSRYKKGILNVDLLANKLR